MNEDLTKQLPNSALQQILERLDSINVRLTSLEGGMSSLEGRMSSLEEKVAARKYETKPIWERALQEIAETRIEMRAGFEEVRANFEKIEGRFDLLEEKLEVLADDVITLRAKHKRLALRVREIETAPVQ